MLEPEDFEIDQPIIKQSANLPEFEDAYGESLNQTLNLDTWIHGEDLAEIYGRLDIVDKEI